MILTAYSAGAVTQIQIKCRSNSAADVADVLNRIARYMHPGQKFDDAPYHAAMKQVAEQYDAERREKRKREHA